MAAKIGIGVADYSKIERNEIGLDIDKLSTIAEALSVSIDQIMDFDDKMVFNNYGTGIGASHFYSVNHNNHEETSKIYEEEINHLKEEILFLRGLVEGREKGNGENS